MKTNAKSRCLNQREYHNHTTHRKRKPAETQCFRRFLAGAEGLEPSARGFGVDVGKCSKEQGRAGVDQFLPQVRKGAVLVWCGRKFSEPKQAKKSGKSPEKQEIH